MQVFDDFFSLLFLIFLLLFMLIGQVPGLQRKIMKLLGLPDEDAPVEAMRGEAPEAGRKAVLKAQETSSLDELEYMALRHLALARGRGLSLKRISSELHLGRHRTQAALSSLRKKGLIRQASFFGLGNRFYLTEKGRSAAIAQGFILSVRK